MSDSRSPALVDDIRRVVQFCVLNAIGSFRFSPECLKRVCPICSTEVQIERVSSYRNHVKSCSPTIFRELVEHHSMFFGTLGQIQRSELANVAPSCEAFDRKQLDLAIWRIRRSEPRLLSPEIWWENPTRFIPQEMRKMSDRTRQASYLRPIYRSPDQTASIDAHRLEQSLFRYEERCGILEQVFDVNRELPDLAIFEQLRLVKQQQEEEDS